MNREDSYNLVNSIFKNEYYHSISIFVLIYIILNEITIKI